MKDNRQSGTARGEKNARPAGQATRGRKRKTREKVMAVPGAQPSSTAGRDRPWGSVYMRVSRSHTRRAGEKRMQKERIEEGTRREESRMGEPAVFRATVRRAALTSATRARSLPPLGQAGQGGYGQKGAEGGKRGLTASETTAVKKRERRQRGTDAATAA